MNVKSLCLGALCLQEGTGYDIKKLFESAFSHFHSASFGSIYPALGQLEKEELVSQRVEPGGGRPDRKIYSVTDAGRAAFVGELSKTPPREQFRSEFMVLMFFSHLLSSERLAQILDEIEGSYARELAYLESIHGNECHTAGIDFTIESGIVTYRAALDFVRRRRGWLLAHHLEPKKPLHRGALCD